jgi:hypothetical protein
MLSNGKRQTCGDTEIQIHALLPGAFMPGSRNSPELDRATVAIQDATFEKHLN